MAHDAGVFEMVYEIFTSLDTGIFDNANLLTIEFFPFLAVEFFVEWSDEPSVDEVDEGITDITIVLEEKLKDKHGSPDLL